MYIIMNPLQHAISQLKISHYKFFQVILCLTLLALITTKQLSVPAQFIIPKGRYLSETRGLSQSRSNLLSTLCILMISNLR